MFFFNILLLQRYVEINCLYKLMICFVVIGKIGFSYFLLRSHLCCIFVCAFLSAATCRQFVSRQLTSRLLVNSLMYLCEVAIKSIIWRELVVNSDFVKPQFFFLILVCPKVYIQISLLLFR